MEHLYEMSVSWQANRKFNLLKTFQFIELVTS